MDKLDKISIAALLVLSLFSLFLVVRENSKEEPAGVSENVRREAQAKRYFDPNFSKKIGLVKKMMIAGSIDNAEKLTAEIMKAYPYDGIPYMLAGDLKLRRQNVIEAALQYRKAVDLNPDFLDKKATEFQGKKIKRTVEEALTEIDKAINTGDSSQKMKENRNAMYYMLRKIAGSCS